MAKAKKRKKKKKRDVKRYGQIWADCIGANEAELDALEAQIGAGLPSEVRDLLLACAGGMPAEDSYYDRKHDTEVGVGHVLCVDAGGSKLETVSEALQRSPKPLIPFATDTGHDGTLCVDASGQVVYYTTDPLRARSVADSLDVFLNGLTDELDSGP